MTFHNSKESNILAKVHPMVLHSRGGDEEEKFYDICNSLFITFITVKKYNISAAVYTSGVHYGAPL